MPEHIVKLTNNNQGSSTHAMSHAVPSAGAEWGAVFVFRRAVTAGAGGAADDVTIADANVPFRMRIVDALFLTTAGDAGGRTVTLRSLAGGLGTAYTSAITSTATGTARNNLTVATAVAAQSSSLFLRRSDSAIAGELTIFAQPESA